MVNIAAKSTVLPVILVSETVTELSLVIVFDCLRQRVRQFPERYLLDV